MSNEEMIIRITLKGKNVEDAFVVLPNGSKTISIEKIYPGDEKYKEILNSSKNNNNEKHEENNKNTNKSSTTIVLNEKLSVDKNPTIHKSITPSLDIPNTSITDCILTNARKNQIKKKNAYIRGLTKSISISYAQFTRGVFKLAKGLLDKGFQKGDVASLYLLNLHEYALIFHAVILLGGVVHPTLLKLDEVQLYNQYKITKPRFIFTLHKNNMFVNAKNAADKVGGNTGEFIIYLDVSQTNEGTKFVDLFMNDGKGFEHKIEGTDIVISNPSKSPSTHVININPKIDLALIAFDENNTPISYTHQNLVAQIHQLDSFFGDKITQEDVFLVSAPYSSIFGLQMFMNFPLYKCSTIVILPPINKDNFIEHVAHFKVSISSLPPSLYSKLSYQAGDLSSLRYLLLTSPLTMSKHSRGELTNLFKSPTVILGCYGEYKHSGISFCDSVASPFNSTSSGQLLPNVEAKIIDPKTGLSVKDGELGELLLKGPNIVSSHLNPSLIKQYDDQDFFRTKLIAKVEKNGFTIYDNSDNALLFKNSFVYPSHIEELMLSHDHVTEAYFFMDSNGSYQINVVLKENSNVASSELLSYISPKLPNGLKVESVNIETAIVRKSTVEWDYTN